MEQRSRTQKYQQLRQTMVAEPENVVKSNDLSRYAKKMETYQTPSTKEFQFEKQEPEFGSRSRTSEDYLSKMKKESDTIDQLLQENEELMKKTITKPEVKVSRANKYASMFVLDDEPEMNLPHKPQDEPVVDDWFDVKPVEKEEPEEVATVVESEEVRKPLQENKVPAFEQMPVVEEENDEPDFDIDSYEEEPVIQDHFMDDILFEAKKYSVDKGQRAEIDTTATILSELTQTAQEPSSYEGTDPLDKEFEFDSTFASEVEELLANVSSYDEPEEEESELKVEEDVQAQIEAIVNDSMDDEPQDEELAVEQQTIAVEEEANDLEDTQNTSITSHEIERDDYMELTMKLDHERILREEMMQKTKQMKLQLDEYENELNLVTNKVSHTSMVLNFVLILLIIALFCLLAFIAYWALVDRGLIAMTSVEDVYACFSALGEWV